MAFRELSLQEKWEIDAESYGNKEAVNTKVPQCENCCFCVKGDALHCKKYDVEMKPKEVLFAEKECIQYQDNTPITFNVEKSDKIDRFFGGIFGLCIGDTLGVPVEFSDRIDLIHNPIRELRAYGTYHQPFGSWSDDSSLTLCLLDSLCDPEWKEKLKRNMIAYYDEGAFTPSGIMFDIGNTTRLAIERMKAGIVPENCGGKLESDNGNGSLMRILPIAFLADKMDVKQVMEMTFAVSSYTHGHSISKFACFFYVLFAAGLYAGKDLEEAYEETIKEIKNLWDEEIPAPFVRLMNKSVVDLPENAIKSTPYVVDTLEAAIWCLFHNTSYENTVLAAVNLGGDTDTIAAVAGGLAGVLYGYLALPERWIQVLKRKEFIYQLSEKFMNCKIK